jgi:hypothetical protein
MASTKGEVTADAGAHNVSLSPTAPTADEMRRYSVKWWRHRNLRALNLWMLVPLLSIFAQG